MKKYSMLTDSPGKSLFFFALPMILGNLFQQFYSAVDSIIVGQYVGEDALAAVGASYSLTTVFIMIAIGGGIGASVIISQYLGAGLFRKMKTSVYTALISFLAVSLILGSAGLLLSRNILTALNTPENILSDALLYLDIYFVGLPFLFMYNILSSVFNALGNSKTPLYRNGFGFCEGAGTGNRGSGGGYSLGTGDFGSGFLLPFASRPERVSD